MAVTGFGRGPQKAPSSGLAGAGQVVSVIGALSSLALVGGLAVWGYQLAKRDVAGVPVIQAMSEPMRHAPEVPGGQIAVHQGLSVNAVVASAGDASATTEQDDAPLHLAPLATDLAPEDRAETERLADGPDDPDVLATAVDDAVTRALALVDDLVMEPGQATDAADVVTDDTATAQAGAPGRSLRPQARPTAVFAQAGLTGISSTSAAAGVAPRDLTVDDLTPGTRLAQIGTFDDAETARAAWESIAARSGALMDGKARVIQAAASGGLAFYRLRVHGFDSEDDARRFCAALESPSQRCTPVTHR